MVRRKQRSCHECRARHLKCDGQQPTCGHCRRGVRTCSKESDHVILGDTNLDVVRRRRRYNLNFTDQHTWLGLPPVTFTDQSAAPSSSSTTTQSQTASPRSSLNNAAHLASSYPISYTGPEDIEYGSYGHDKATNIADPYTTTSPPETTTLWPFTSPQEATLMHHYTTTLAPWFDHSDTTKHFGLILPNLAATCPPLLNAILALSSRHLYLQGQLSESLTLHYQAECFRTLLPDLQTRAFEAPMLAAVNISRVAAHDAASHSLLGLEVFVDAWRRNPTSTLHAAIFMNVLRLYIHVALINKQPLSQVSANCCLMKAICPESDDPRLVNFQITMLVVFVTGFCYDDEPKSSERWLRLDSDLRGWRDSLPAAFFPTFQAQPTEDNPCGTVTFANDIHAATHQYYCLARLLLLNNIPTGTSQPLSPAGAKKESLFLLRRVNAVATSHSTSMGIVLMSTLPILTHGHLLPDKASQKLALGIMFEAQRNCAAVTCPGTVGRLREAWGWGDEGGGGGGEGGE